MCQKKQKNLHLPNADKKKSGIVIQSLRIHGNIGYVVGVLLSWQLYFPCSILNSSMVAIFDYQIVSSPKKIFAGKTKIDARTTVDNSDGNITLESNIAI